MAQKVSFLTILFLWISIAAFAQELPPMERYTPSEYGGDNQNWMISQDEEKYIYVANNMGLLVFNGASWNLYASPNNTVLRAVKVVKDKIYTGCYAEFGYWERNNLGSLKYISLIPKLDSFSFEDNQIWNILAYEDWVLFQSAHHLFFFDSVTEKFKIINSENIIYKVFKVNDEIYYHVANEGIFKIDNGAPRLIIDAPVVIKDRVINIFKKSGDLLLVTRNSGLYLHNKSSFTEWLVPSRGMLKNLNIFSCAQRPNESLILGTISNGLVVMNKTGEIEYQLNQKNGLGNNTVLNLFEDQDNNVWVGLDNGITCVNVDSPIKTFIDYDGVIGTVYTINTFKDNLYVGTNQGLFVRPLAFPSEKFKFVEGTAGQVWSLYNDDEKSLLCGHHLGAFQIQGEQSVQVSNVLGAWNFREIPNHKNLLLQGNYSGLYILENINGEWKERNKLDDFTTSSRFFEINENQEVWVNHEYKGCYRLKLDSLFTRITETHIHTELPKMENSSLVTHQGDLLFASISGLYKYNSVKQMFFKDSILNALLLTPEYTSGKMIVDKNGRLWTFSQDYISYIDNNDVSNKLEITNIPIPADMREGVLSFENIQYLDTDTYVLGTTSGYITIDLSEKGKKKNHIIHLNEIAIKKIDEISIQLPIDDIGELEYKEGTISFDYSIPEYDKYLDIQFQYKLEGLSDRWSHWTSISKVQFENLTFGNFTFMVKAKVGNEISSNIASYHFKVKRPWYISNIALLIYLLFLGFIGFIINKAYKFYYERILKHEQIKNEKTIIQIQNEKLNQDIESKNSELAISTMSIIRKNELLGKIKKDLQKNNIESTIKLIDDNLVNSSDWNLFKEAFNNVDKDFLNKIKSKHPELTPNDLKFCAYLRLNLSSKEIAPLLNISTKSVETKRYRLRKRLGLNHQDGLVDYILQF